MTRESGRWSLDTEKRRRLFSPDKLLAGLAVMAPFAMMDKTEATQGARRWSLDNNKEQEGF